MTDAAFAVHPTPIGDALIVLTGVGLVSLQLLDAPSAVVLGDMARALGTAPEHDPETAAGVAADLDDYFAGRLRSFGIPLDWRLTAPGFARDALRAVCEIPYGEVASYGEVAAAVGSPRAHRAVGSACARTPISIIVPAHRVVRSDGSIGEYGGHPERKRFLLDLEAGVRPARV